MLRPYPLTPRQLADRIDREDIYAQAQRLLSLTYTVPRKELPTQINTVLATLPGGAEWFE